MWYLFKCGLCFGRKLTILFYSRVLTYRTGLICAARSPELPPEEEELNAYTLKNLTFKVSIFSTVLHTS